MGPTPIDAGRSDRFPRGHRRRPVHAFPSVDNVASNALCRSLGFVLLGEVDVEYPKGSTMRSNDWRLDLEDRPVVRSRRAEQG